MFLKATTSQTFLILRKKGAVCVFYILLGMVLYNFVRNVFAFQGRDVAQMYQPMKLLLLSYNRTNYNADMTLLFTQLYPILVVCPAGFALAREYQRGTDVYLVSRLGARTYQFSKLLSCFLATTIVFTLPFLIEILLNCISFPLNATGDLSNLGFYAPDYAEDVNNYLGSDLFLFSPYLYAVAMTFLFGAVSGLLGAFTAAISATIKIKYNIFLFFPVFILLNATTLFSSKITAGVSSIIWYDYLLLFNENPKNIWLFMGFVFLIFCFSGYAVWNKSRKDCL